MTWNSKNLLWTKLSSVREIDGKAKLLTRASSSTRRRLIMNLQLKWGQKCILRKLKSLTFQVNIIGVNSNDKLASGSGTFITFFYSPTDNQCGMPPVPVDADVVGTIFPGKTTRVVYRCKNNLVRNRRGSRRSTCDQLTGQWTEVPSCIPVTTRRFFQPRLKRTTVRRFRSYR